MSNRSSVDERTSAPSEASRRGAHRARPKAVPSGLPVLAGVAVILLVIGGVFYGLRDTSVTSTGTITGADADSSETASATPRSSASSTPRAASSSAGSSAGSSATATRTAAPVTHDVQVVVLNSLRVQGLAARAKTALESDGWKVTRTDNSTQKNLATSVVYYGRTNLRATARQIVDDLGYGASKFDSGVSTGTTITVVLGADAQ